MKKKVVVIGGGNGSAKSIRACLQSIDSIELSAVISISDSGGSSGVLRHEFNILPTGDLLRAILAMSKYDYDILKSIFYSVRFGNVHTKLDTHNLGNLFLALAGEYSGHSMLAAIRAMEQSVEACGIVHPAALESGNLVAELADGSIVRGEHEIDRQGIDKSRIKKVWLDPEIAANPEAIKSIEEADYIVVGPGSLYCSVVATLLPRGIYEAIRRSKATLLCVAGNAYEVHGESGPRKLSEIVSELEQYLPRKLDIIVYNNAQLTSEQLQWYTQKQWALFEADLENMQGYEILQGDYEREERPGLDDHKLGILLHQLCNRKQ